MVTHLRIIVALILLAFWPVMTSHPLLQDFGLIHEVHADHDSEGGSHEHDTHNHAFADGDYVRGSSEISVWKPFASVSAFACVTALLLALVTLTRGDLRNRGLPPPGTAPPELSPRWQFSSRAALPVRAPSFVS